MKKELTAQEKYKKLNTQAKVYRGLKYVSIASPFVIIGAVNWKNYFTETSGVSVSIGFVLCAIILAISLIKEMKKDTNKKFNGLTIWGVCFVLSILFKTILADLTLILGCGLGGQVIGTMFNSVADKKKALANIYNEGLIRAETQKEG